MNLRIKKSLIIFLILLCAIVLPIVILLLFFLIFSDFYDKGILTGFGHIFVCGLMILLNLIIGTPLIIMFTQNRDDNFNRIMSIIFISIVLQVTLNILIENPFKEPSSSFGFL